MRPVLFDVADGQPGSLPRVETAGHHPVHAVQAHAKELTACCGAIPGVAVPN